MKNFRLLFAVSSLLALVCSFTSCSTDLSEEYPTISLSVTPGETTASSVTFTIKAEGADEIYYWVVNTATQDPENTQLLIEKGTYLDAQTDVQFEQEVVKSSLAASTEYCVYVYAKNFAHHAYATPATLTTKAAVVVATPEVKELVVDTESVTAKSFVAFLTAANAQKAAWYVVPKYTDGVTAAKALEAGVAIEGPFVDENGQPTEVGFDVTGLQGSTDYDLYVALENQGVAVLSAPVAVTTAEAVTILEMNFDELMASTNLVDAIGLPGLWVTLANSATGAVANLFMYDFLDYPNYAGYLSSGLYPVLAGNLENNDLPFSTCLLGDPSFTNFQDANGVYSPVVKSGADYGISLLTVMPAQDNNELTFNVPVVDAEGNEYVIKGSYVGALGYIGNLAAYSMDLREWSFTKFVLTTEGNTVTLTSNNQNGSFVIALQTENGKWASAESEASIAFVAGEGGNMTGGYTSYLEGEPELFSFVSGRISFTKVDDNGNYILNVAYPRANMDMPDWLMQGKSGAYKIVAPEEGYPITVTVAQ